MYKWKKRYKNSVLISLNDCYNRCCLCRQLEKIFVNSFYDLRKRQMAYFLRSSSIHVFRFKEMVAVIGTTAVSPSQSYAANNVLSENNYLWLSTKSRTCRQKQTNTLRRPMYVGLHCIYKVSICFNSCTVAHCVNIFSFAYEDIRSWFFFASYYTIAITANNGK